VHAPEDRVGDEVAHRRLDAAVTAGVTGDVLGDGADDLGADDVGQRAPLVDDLGQRRVGRAALQDQVVLRGGPGPVDVTGSPVDDQVQLGDHTAVLVRRRDQARLAVRVVDGADVRHVGVTGDD